jgi:signal transduction histidine kinase
MNEPLRALIVEDSEDDTALLLRALRRGGYDATGYRVETPLDFGAAIDAQARAQAWDIVLSDWSMPQFSALEALRIVKGRGIDLPFIIVSGTVGEDVAVECLKAGAQDFVTKGNLTRLIPAIRRELRELAVRRESRKLQEHLMVSDRMISIGILAAGVAHEINNPLTSLLMNVDHAVASVEAMLAGRTLSRPGRPLLEGLLDARDSAQRIRDIVKEVKLFARGGDEAVALLDVERVLESALRMARHEVQSRANLTRDYGQVPLVRANEAKLGQVFLNLVINAVQAIPEGKPGKHEIRVRTMEQDGAVVIEIRDTGAGMSADVLQRIFTPFFTTKPVGVGTGLGLSICRRIVAAVGGDISATSTVGKGSTFRITLPAVHEADLDERAHAPSLAKASSPKASGEQQQRQRPRVLVVGQDRPLCAAIERALRRDHDVVATDSPSEAATRIEGGARFDAIICDSVAEDGEIAFHARVLESAPDQAARVVFLTDCAPSRRVAEFLERCGNRRVEKPCGMATLWTIVAELSAAGVAEPAHLGRGSATMATGRPSRPSRTG